MNYTLVGILSALPMAAAVALDAQTNVPFGWLIGSIVTIFGTGFWVSRTATRLESRMDYLEKRQDHLERRRG